MVEGYYEWKNIDSEGKKKEPYYIKHFEKQCLFLAGLYREIKDDKVNLNPIIIG